jgi:hypothetical protein
MFSLLRTRRERRRDSRAGRRDQIAEFQPIEWHPILPGREVPGRISNWQASVTGTVSAKSQDQSAPFAASPVFPQELKCCCAAAIGRSGPGTDPRTASKVGGDPSPVTMVGYGAGAGGRMRFTFDARSPISFSVLSYTLETLYVEMQSGTLA